MTMSQTELQQASLGNHHLSAFQRCGTGWKWPGISFSPAKAGTVGGTLTSTP